MSEDDFWRVTPPELTALLEKIAERDTARERAASLRAGLIASAIYNVHRKKGTPAFQPGDFVSQPVQYVDGEVMREIVHSWLKSGRH